MIVRTSILGSIIVNILLVLGLVILTGEMQERGQTYNLLATRVAAGLLCVAAVVLLIPVRFLSLSWVFYSQLTRLA
jgi:Ca2+:H+ antiporter